MRDHRPDVLLLRWEALPSDSEVNLDSYYFAISAAPAY